LQFDLRKAYDYLKQQQAEANDFYFITRDTGDPKVGLRQEAFTPPEKTQRPDQRQDALRLGWSSTALPGRMKPCLSGKAKSSARVSYL
jgi:hypothetical protein